MTDSNKSTIQARILQTVNPNPEKPAEQQTFSIKEAAAFTGYHVSHITKVVSDKILPAKKDERSRWAIKRSDLDDWMKTKTVKPKRTTEYTRFEKDNDDPKTILTLLEEAHDEIERLGKEVGAKDNGLADELKRREQELIILRKQVDDAESEAAFYRENNENMKTEMAQLREADRDNTKFMRELIKDMTGSRN